MIRTILAASAVVVCAGSALAQFSVSNGFREVRSNTRELDFFQNILADDPDFETDGTTSGDFNAGASSAIPGATSDVTITSGLSPTLLNADFNSDSTSDGFFFADPFDASRTWQATGGGDFDISFTVGSTGFYPYAFGWDFVGTEQQSAIVQLIDTDTNSVLIQRTSGADGLLYNEVGNVPLSAGTNYLVDVNFSTTLGVPFGAVGPLAGTGDLSFRLAVPAPGGAALLAIGGLCAARRRR